MSAYALPGIFPPIVDNSSNTSNLMTENAMFGFNDPPVSVGHGEREAGTTTLHTFDSSSSSTNGIGNLLLQSAVDRFCPYPTNILSNSPTSSDPDAGPTKTPNATSECHETSNHSQQALTESVTSSSSSLSTMFIAVKEAKIDPVRLIQYLTGTMPQHQQGKTLRRRGSKERLSSSGVCNTGGGTPALLSLPIHRKRSTTQLPSSQDASTTTIETSQNSKKNSIPASPHEEAIEFELSISFHGRKYTAKRTMQCIVQLRDDLIREMNHRKQWLSRERGWSDDSTNAESNQKDGSTFDPNNHHNNQRKRTTASAGQDPHEYIPEIPPLTTEERGGFSGGAGFVGRGFTMLHAMVTSYVPVMERWLKNVLTIVPQDSECLMNFLWEPVESTTLPEDFVTKMSCTSLATLGSIKELDYNTEDSDDDDDFCETSWDRT